MCSHQVWIQFFGVVVDPPGIGIMMEFCVNGDLLKFLERLREAANPNPRHSTTIRSPYALTNLLQHLHPLNLYDVRRSFGFRKSAASLRGHSDLSDHSWGTAWHPMKTAMQICQGMNYLHNSKVGAKGRYNASSDVISDEHRSSTVISRARTCCLTLTGMRNSLTLAIHSSVHR